MGTSTSNAENGKPLSIYCKRSFRKRLQTKFIFSKTQHNSFETNDANNYDTSTSEVITESQPTIKTRSGRIIDKLIRYRQ